MLDALFENCPSKCLGLEPKWRWPLWNSKTAHPTQSCLHPNGGVPWGLREWTFFKYQQNVRNRALRLDEMPVKSTKPLKMLEMQETPGTFGKIPGNLKSPGRFLHFLAFLTC